MASVHDVLLKIQERRRPQRSHLQEVLGALGFYDEPLRPVGPEELAEQPVMRERDDIVLREPNLVEQAKLALPPELADALDSMGELAGFAREWGANPVDAELAATPLLGGVATRIQAMQEGAGEAEKLVRAARGGDSGAIRKMAEEMAPHVKPGSTIVPMPGKKGVPYSTTVSMAQQLADMAQAKMADKLRIAGNTLFVGGGLPKDAVVLTDHIGKTQTPGMKSLERLGNDARMLGYTMDMSERPIREWITGLPARVEAWRAGMPKVSDGHGSFWLEMSEVPPTLEKAQSIASTVGRPAKDGNLSFTRTLQSMNPLHLSGDQSNFFDSFLGIPEADIIKGFEEFPAETAQSLGINVSPEELATLQKLAERGAGSWSFRDYLLPKVAEAHGHDLVMYGKGNTTSGKLGTASELHWLKDNSIEHARQIDWKELPKKMKLLPPKSAVAAKAKPASGKTMLDLVEKEGWDDQSANFIKLMEAKGDELMDTDQLAEVVMDSFDPDTPVGEKAAHWMMGLGEAGQDTAPASDILDLYYGLHGKSLPHEIAAKSASKAAHTTAAAMAKNDHFWASAVNDLENQLTKLHAKPEDYTGLEDVVDSVWQMADQPGLTGGSHDPSGAYDALVEHAEEFWKGLGGTEVVGKAAELPAGVNEATAKELKNLVENALSGGFDAHNATVDALADAGFKPGAEGQPVYDWLAKYAKGLVEGTSSGSGPKLDEDVETVLKQLVLDGAHDPQDATLKVMKTFGIPLDDLNTFAKVKAKAKELWNSGNSLDTLNMSMATSLGGYPDDEAFLSAHLVDALPTMSSKFWDSKEFQVWKDMLPEEMNAGDFKAQFKSLVHNFEALGKTSSKAAVKLSKDDYPLVLGKLDMPALKAKLEAKLDEAVQDYPDAPGMLVVEDLLEGLGATQEEHPELYEKLYKHADKYLDAGISSSDMKLAEKAIKDEVFSADWDGSTPPSKADVADLVKEIMSEKGLPKVEHPELFNKLMAEVLPNLPTKEKLKVTNKAATKKLSFKKLKELIEDEIATSKSIPQNAEDMTPDDISHVINSVIKKSGVEPTDTIWDKLLAHVQEYTGATSPSSAAPKKLTSTDKVALKSYGVPKKWHKNFHSWVEEDGEETAAIFGFKDPQDFEDFLNEVGGAPSDGPGFKVKLTVAGEE